MAARCYLTSALLLASVPHAATLNLRQSSDETVCVSVAAFETPDYIEALIENFLHFSERSTKLAIHLDFSSDYNGTENEWASDRVAITQNRVDVKAFHGSVLYSHMLNVDTMEKTWPHQCAYWVLQASNMMWVRKGMEEHVRDYRFSPLGSHTNGGGPCAWNHEIEDSKTFVGFSEKLNSRKNVYGWGQPEGSFFPFSMVKDFKAMMDQHLRKERDSGSGIYDAKCYFENVWLQTYALNYADVPEGPEYEERRKKSTPLCLNSIHYGDKENDAIEMDQLKAVMAGKDWAQGFYAVKRVNRKVTHPTTRFIINLAKGA